METQTLADLGITKQMLQETIAMIERSIPPTSVDIIRPYIVVHVEWFSAQGVRFVGGGVAKCRANDSWDPALGTAIARGRAIKAMARFFLTGQEEYHAANARIVSVE